MAGTINFPGIGSGIDAARIARSVFEQASLPAEIHRQSIEQIHAESTSLERLRTLLLDVSDKLDALRSTNGGAMVNTASSANDAVAQAVADSTAAVGSFSLTVSSVAAPASGSFNRGFQSADEVILADAGQSGTLTFSVGAGEEAQSFSVAVGPTTTAQNLVDQFNSEADGVARAQLINLGTESNPEYRISFSTEALGVEQGSIAVEAGNQSLFEGDALGQTTIEQATNAVFSVEGISGSFERSTNSISDVIDGVSINLRGTGSTQIDIARNPGLSADQLQAFVSSFNSLVQFVNAEDKVEILERNEESVNDFGSLARSSLDENALSGLRTALLGAKSADGSMSLAQMGVSTERDGTLSFDREKFTETYTSDPEKAAQAFTALADRVSGVQGVVQQFTGYGMGIDQAVQSNDSEADGLGDSISRVERAASQKQEAILKQMASLEGLLAKLNADSGIISSLLQF